VERRVLGDGALDVPVSGLGGEVDDAPDPDHAGGLEDVHRPVDVGRERRDGQVDGEVRVGHGGGVDDAPDVVATERVHEPREVVELSLDVDDVLLRALRVVAVVADDGLPPPGEVGHEVPADVAEAPCDHRAHLGLSLSLILAPRLLAVG
jgi:hypothetical protein